MSGKGAASGAASGASLGKRYRQAARICSTTPVRRRCSPVSRWPALRHAGDVQPEGYAVGAGLGAQGLHLGTDAVGAGDVQAGARPAVTMAMASSLSLHMAVALRLASVA